MMDSNQNDVEFSLRIHTEGVVTQGTGPDPARLISNPDGTVTILPEGN